jgi:hypothetical protein
VRDWRIGSFMNWTDSLLGFVRAHEPLMLLVSSALVLCLVLFSLFLAVRLARLSKSTRAHAATAHGSGRGDIEALNRRLEGAEEEIVLLGERGNVLDERLGRTVQRIGLVRFDAFPDVGGEQSFALALLDREMSGLVLSSLYGRSDSRVYAKEIAEGRSQHALSDEELEALRRAGSP